MKTKNSEDIKSVIIITTIFFREYNFSVFQNNII